MTKNLVFYLPLNLLIKGKAHMFANKDIIICLIQTRFHHSDRSKLLEGSFWVRRIRIWGTVKYQNIQLAVHLYWRAIVTVVLVLGTHSSLQWVWVIFLFIFFGDQSGSTTNPSAVLVAINKFHKFQRIYCFYRKIHYNCYCKICRF